MRGWTLWGLLMVAAAATTAAADDPPTIQAPLEAAVADPAPPAERPGPGGMPIVHPPEQADGKGAQPGVWPFVGAVIGTDVNLRAGPTTQYEVMARLAHDERLLVTAESWGWYAVRPRRTIEVFVHGDYVSDTPSGMGMVKSDRVNVRARAEATATVVGQVNRGDLVKVLARTGTWAKVEAPPTVSFWIHRDFVRRTDDEPAEAPIAVAQEEPQAPRTNDATDLLIEARDLYLIELEKDDMDAMRFDAALARYEEALRKADREVVKQAAQAGIQRVQVAMRLQQDYRERMRRLERVGGTDRP